MNDIAVIRGALMDELHRSRRDNGPALRALARVEAERDRCREGLKQAQSDLQRLASPTRMSSGEVWDWVEETQRRLQLATAGNTQARIALRNDNA